MAKSRDTITNYYQVIPQHLKKKYHNPQYGKKHFIKVPFRALLCGGSGSGKTNLLLELIHRMSGTFTQIVVCCKSRHEPLYDYLSSKVPEDCLQFYEGVENIPPIEDFSGCGQTLIVFDDLCMDKKQNIIEQYFIRGRKVGEGISCCYLTQSYYKTPKSVRLQCNQIFLKKLSSQRDLRMILSEVSIGMDIKRLTACYKYATREPLNFLLIDVEAPDDDGKIRSGFMEICK